MEEKRPETNKSASIVTRRTVIIFAICIALVLLFAQIQTDARVSR